MFFGVDFVLENPKILVRNRKSDLKESLFNYF